MKKFLMLTYGFEKPTEEIMQAWGKWFGEIGDAIVERGHLPRGVEFSKTGRRELGMDLEAITGYLVVRAESLEAAEKMAETNPYITAIRVYEVMEG